MRCGQRLEDEDTEDQTRRGTNDIEDTDDTKGPTRRGGRRRRRAVNLWRPDAPRMAAAVAHFAPGIRVIDQDAGQVTPPAG